MLKPMYDYGIGNTPLYELPSINGNKLYIKMESENFLGSIKARTGYALVNGLKIPKDRIIIETSSGNLALALDFFCKEAGRPFFCLLDETIVPIKLHYILSKGVKCEIVPTEPGLDARTSRMKRADAMVSAGTHFWVNQCDNEDGVTVHKQTTAREVFEQTSGKVTCVFCSVGSGGTVCGVGEYFKEKGSNVKVIGVEPYGSTIFNTVEGTYISSGAGLRGKPGNLLRHIDVINKSYVIHDHESVSKYIELNKKLNIKAGLTAGMLYAAAEKYCATAGNEKIVLVAADGAEYYSEYLREHGREANVCSE